MARISVKGLTFSYEGSYDNIFENVSFDMDTEWKLGMTGRNGRGKTTLLRLLTGEGEYRGSISAPVRFRDFPYAAAAENATAGEVFMEASGAEEWRAMREYNLMGLPERLLSQPFSTLSGGERTRLLLCALFTDDDSFPLLDEPTNHLDGEARDIVARYLTKKKGFILVSHDRALLNRCVDHILSINRADIEVIRGNYDVWEAERKRRDEFERAQNEKIGREIERLNSAAKRTADWSDRVEASKIGEHSPDRGRIGAKAAKLMARSKATQKRIEKAAEQKEGLLHNIEMSRGELKLYPLQYQKERMAELSGVSVNYGERDIRVADFSLLRGERVALCGANGCGKSSVLKLICGEKIPHTGRVTAGSGLIISYVPQDTSALYGGLSEYAEARGVELTLFYTILRKLDFPRVQFEKRLEELSGGQKKKALIAASLASRAHLYVWDEPLNFIDVLSRVQIEELILKYRPTMLFVEHDETFIQNVATKKIDMGTKPGRGAS